MLLQISCLLPGLKEKYWVGIKGVAYGVFRVVVLSKKLYDFTDPGSSHVSCGVDQTPRKRKEEIGR